MATEEAAERPTRWTRLAGPALIGLGITAAVLTATVLASPSTFTLLGAGRGLVAEEFYPLWGFVLLLATVVALVIGWIGGSALVYYLLTLVGGAPRWATARLAMTLVFLGLVAVPILIFHVVFGDWLLGMARPGVPAWLSQHHPDAYALLIGAHGAIELALIPLTIALLALLWGLGERMIRVPWAQTLLWLVVCLSALAVTLSLTIHSALVHLRVS